MGNDGPWSTFNVKIGSPPQVLEVLPASSMSVTLVVLEEGCTQSEPATCASLRGNTLDIHSLSSWEPLTKDGSQYLFVSLPAEQPLLPYQIPSQVSVNTLVLDWWGNVSAADLTPLEGQLIAGYAATEPYLGFLGLSGWPATPVTGSISYDSPLRSLHNRSVPPRLTWAYTAGAWYEVPERFGSLTFGGYDSSLVNMDDALTGVNFENGDGNELTVTIKSITVGDTAVQPADQDLAALLDSVVPDIWLPKSVCDIFEAKFGLQWNESFEMYLISEEQRDRLRDENTSVSFDLAPDINSPTFATITLPYLAFDHEVKWPKANISDNTTLRYFPLKPTPEGTTNFLGRTFFQEA